MDTLIHAIMVMDKKVVFAETLALMESQIVHVVDPLLKANSFAAQILKISVQITFLVGLNSKVFHRIAFLAS